MVNKYCFNALDKITSDVVRFSNPNSLNNLFGRKVVVFGDDFKQILPLIPKGGRQDVVHATINSSYLWDYCKVLTLTQNMRLLTSSNEVPTYDTSKSFLNGFFNLQMAILANLMMERLQFKFQMTC